MQTMAAPSCSRELIDFIQLVRGVNRCASVGSSQDSIAVCGVFQSFRFESLRLAGRAGEEEEEGEEEEGEEAVDWGSESSEEEVVWCNGPLLRSE